MSNINYDPRAQGSRLPPLHEIKRARRANFIVDASIIFVVAFVLAYLVTGAQ